MDVKNRRGHRSARRPTWRSGEALIVDPANRSSSIRRTAHRRSGEPLIVDPAGGSTDPPRVS